MKFKRRKKKLPSKIYSVAKACRFCNEKTFEIDYKNAKTLRTMITDRGKIIPKRISGTCAKHQRLVATAVNRARNIALVPFTV